jgi:hypothetical protein
MPLRKHASLWTWLIAVLVFVLHFEIAGVALDDAAAEIGVECIERGELRVGSESEDGDDKDDEAAAIAKTGQPQGVLVLGPRRIGGASVGPRAGHHATPDRPPDIG